MSAIQQLLASFSKKSGPSLWAGVPSGHLSVDIQSISDDGLTISGETESASNTIYGFLWTSAGGGVVKPHTEGAHITSADAKIGINIYPSDNAVLRGWDATTGRTTNIETGWSQQYVSHLSRNGDYGIVIQVDSGGLFTMRAYRGIVGWLASGTPPASSVIAVPSGYSGFIAIGVCDNGAVYGSAYHTATNKHHMFRWALGDATAIILSSTPPAGYSLQSGASVARDGTDAALFYFRSDDALSTKAFVYTPAGGLVAIEIVPGVTGYISLGTFVSSSPILVLGSSVDSSTWTGQAGKWEEGTGWSAYPQLSGAAPYADLLAENGGVGLLNATTDNNASPSIYRLYTYDSANGHVIVPLPEGAETNAIISVQQWALGGGCAAVNCNLAGDDVTYAKYIWTSSGGTEFLGPLTP